MVGSTVVLYMIFGSLGLLVVGVMGGVVLHASLENLRPNKARNEGPAIGGSAADWLDRKILEIQDRKEGISFEEGGRALLSTKVWRWALSNTFVEWELTTRRRSRGFLEYGYRIFQRCRQRPR